MLSEIVPQLDLGLFFVIVQVTLISEGLVFHLSYFPEGSGPLQYDENIVGSLKIEAPQFSNKSLTSDNK